MSLKKYTPNDTTNSLVTTQQLGEQHEYLHSNYW